MNGSRAWNGRARRQDLMPATAPIHDPLKLNHSIGSDEGMTPLEDAGPAKEIAEKVRQGKASLRIVETPWGVEFYIHEKGTRGSSLRPRNEILIPSTQILSALAKAGVGREVTPSNQLPAIGGLGSVYGKPSFIALTILCVTSNLAAFLMSSVNPSLYVELDRFVQPGSLFSIATSEGAILALSIFLLAMVRNVTERTVLHSLVLGILAADAVNDLVLISTGDWFLSMELAWLTAASIPTMVGLLLLRRSRKLALQQAGRY